MTLVARRVAERRAEAEQEAKNEIEKDALRAAFVSDWQKEVKSWFKGSDIKVVFPSVSSKPSKICFCVKYDDGKGFSSSLSCYSAGNLVYSSSDHEWKFEMAFERSAVTYDGIRGSGPHCLGEIADLLAEKYIKVVDVAKAAAALTKGGDDVFDEAAEERG